MDTLIFYHSADHDGHCSGAIAQKYYESFGVTPKLIGINYGDKIPDVTGQNVVLLDFCFQPDIEMQKALDTAKSFTWIDHHISAINKFSPNIKGLRDVNFAACELAYKYFFPNLQIPPAIEFLGKFDSWRHDGNQYILGFEYFMQAFNTDPKVFYWEPYFEMSASEILEKAEIGTLILERENQVNLESMKNSFETKINGFSCLCLNSQAKGSLVFGDKLNNYDCCLIYFKTGNNQYNCRIYASMNNQTDVSILAKSFGGGGHKKAAGFQLNKETAERIGLL